MHTTPRSPSFVPSLPLQSEASDVFFSVTKLFQHKDVHLRRMVYLVIKEVIPSSDEVIIITSRWGRLWGRIGARCAAGPLLLLLQGSACKPGKLPSKCLGARSTTHFLSPTPPPARSLMKDMNSNNDLYRANAIRVLCRIIDSQMLLQIERYLKQVGVLRSWAGLWQWLARAPC